MNEYLYLSTRNANVLRATKSRVITPNSILRAAKIDDKGNEFRGHFGGEKHCPMAPRETILVA